MNYFFRVNIGTDTNSKVDLDNIIKEPQLSLYSAEKSILHKVRLLHGRGVFHCDRYLSKSIDINVFKCFEDFLAILGRFLSVARPHLLTYTKS